MLHDSTSQAIAGSSSVGSPWKVTVSVPPFTGWPVAAWEGDVESEVEPPQPAVRNATATAAKAMKRWRVRRCMDAPFRRRRRRTKSV